MSTEVDLNDLVSERADIVPAFETNIYTEFKICLKMEQWLLIG